MWRDRNLPGSIIDITPTNLCLDPFDSLIRGNEVEAWLKKYHIDKDLDSYIIIDDENEYMTKQLPHFVWTNPESGLTKKDAERAIRIIN